jgi:hypothetical protein
MHADRDALAAGGAAACPPWMAAASSRFDLPTGGGRRVRTLLSDKANLDEGAMWPNSFALKELTAAEEAKITALVKQAVS